MYATNILWSQQHISRATSQQLSLLLSCCCIERICSLYSKLFLSHSNAFLLQCISSCFVSTAAFYPRISSCYMRYIFFLNTFWAAYTHSNTLFFLHFIAALRSSQRISRFTSNYVPDPTRFSMLQRVHASFTTHISLNRHRQSISLHVSRWFTVMTTCFSFYSYSNELSLAPDIKLLYAMHFSICCVILQSWQRILFLQFKLRSLLCMSSCWIQRIFLPCLMPFCNHGNAFSCNIFKLFCETATLLPLYVKLSAPNAFLYFLKLL